MKKKSLREIYSNQPKAVQAVADCKRILTRSKPIPRHHIERAMQELAHVR